jgi:hypothetical protein
MRNDVFYMFHAKMLYTGRFLTVQLDGEIEGIQCGSGLNNSTL